MFRLRKIISSYILDSSFTSNSSFPFIEAKICSRPVTEVRDGWIRDECANGAHTIAYFVDSVDSPSSITGQIKRQSFFGLRIVVFVVVFFCPCPKNLSVVCLGGGRRVNLFSTCTSVCVFFF